MQCPECGYAMGEFDVDCKRCERMGEAAATKKAPAPAGDVAPAATLKPATGGVSIQEVPMPQQPGTTIIQMQQVAPEQARRQPNNGSPVGLYVLAVLFPLVGIIWGIVWWTGGDTDEKREWGRIGFCIAIAAIVFSWIFIVIGAA